MTDRELFQRTLAAFITALRDDSADLAVILNDLDEIQLRRALTITLEALSDMLRARANAANVNPADLLAMLQGRLLAIAVDPKGGSQ